MKKNRPVRIIKHNQRVSGESLAKALGDARTQPSERELKTVVSGWIREHRQRSEEYRRAFANLLKESGLRSQGALS
jgi:endonuclease/exonuclease/phosphatase (EEP) superfamily protein YafD